MGTSGSAQDVTREDVRSVFSRLDGPSTPLTAAEVAAQLECPRRTVCHHLADLADVGEVQGKEVGGATHVWWRSPGREGRPDSVEFNAFVSAVRDYAIFMLDPDGTVVSWNEGAERIKGYAEDEIVGEHFSTFYTDDERAEGVPERNLETAATAGRSEDEGWRVRQDGSRFWANVVITAVYDGDGDLQGFTKVTHDMTERREYEHQLHQERDLVEQIFETVPAGIGVIDPDGRYVRANPQMLDRHGIDESDLSEYDLSSLTVYDADGEPTPMDEWPFTRVLETGEPIYDFRCEVDPPHGECRWLSINAAPLEHDADDDRVVVAIDDVTEQKARERQLRRERDQTEQLLRTAPIAIAVQNAEGETVMANRRAQEALGLSEQEIIDAPDDADEWTIYGADGDPLAPDETPSARVLASGEPITDVELTIEPPDGDRMQFIINAAPIFDADGAIERVVTAGEDITELKRRERQLERRKAELETELGEILGRISDAFYALDDEWRFTHLNDRAAEIMRRSREELLGEVVWDAFPDASMVYREQFETAIATQEPITFEVYGDEVDAWLEFNVYPSESGLSIYFRDVTDRKAREQTLAKYETIVETVNDGIYVKDEDGRFTMVNEGYAELTGYDRAELVGAHASLVVDEATIQQARETKEAMMDDDEANPTMEAMVETASGDLVPAEGTFATIETGNGEYEQVGVVRDVSDRKEYERRIEESERRYRTLVEHFPDGVVALFDEDLRHVAAGGELTDELGIESEEAVGETVYERYPDGLVAAVEPHLRAALDGETNSFDVEYHGRHLRAHALPITFTGEDRTGMLVVQDVTERVAYERQLEQYKEYTDRILDAVDDVFYVLDADGNLHRWNESVCEVSGYSDAEVASMHAIQFFDEDARERIADVIAEGFETGSVQVEAMLLTSDGGHIPYEFVASTLDDPDGNPVLAGIGRDVSERREYERKLEASNERLEQFAYAASHDLQEPLRMVSSYLRLVGGRYADELDEDGQEFIEFAVDGADRMREMIEGLLEYSRIETQGDPFEDVDLDSVLADVRDDLQLQIGASDAEVSADPLPTVEGDPNQLRQVFQNLLDNAIEYSGDDPPRVAISAERDGEEWVVSVRDEGIGIDPADADRIFQVFQRLHGDHEGTGIGLALCRRIVERHGGEIRVDSEEGEGATFSFSLPAADS